MTKIISILALSVSLSGCIAAGQSWHCAPVDISNKSVSGCPMNGSGHPEARQNANPVRAQAAPPAKGL